MSEEPQAPFTPEQVKALFAQVISDGPAAANTMADDLETNPRAVVGNYFALTGPQQTAMNNLSDDDLRDRVAGIVRALRDDDGSDLQIVNRDRLDEVEMEEDRGVAVLVCSCIFVAYMSKRAVAF
jgi:hypothetical protein